MMERRYRVIYVALVAVILLLLALNIVVGAVKIPLSDTFDILLGIESADVKLSWIHIIRESRVPQALTALLAGCALATSGLLLQTLFKNPLAGPSILGVSSGANLGVALVMLTFGGMPQIAAASGMFSGYLAVVVAAMIGAGAVLGVIIWFSSRVRSNTMLLIVGIMVGYMVSSMISILNFQSSSDKVHAFVMWGMGDFSSVSNEKLPFFALFSIVGLGVSLLLTKPLNALLLGEMYAANLGVKIKSTRIMILIATGLLTAVTTAFCGPISFIGLAVPHIARLMLNTSNHKHLLPITMMCGGVIAMLCNLLTVIHGDNQIFPLNAITPIIGAPVIIYVIVNRKNIQYFN